MGFVKIDVMRKEAETGNKKTNQTKTKKLTRQSETKNDMNKTGTAVYRSRRDCEQRPLDPATRTATTATATARPLVLRRRRRLLTSASISTSTSKLLVLLVVIMFERLGCVQSS